MEKAEGRYAIVRQEGRKEKTGYYPCKRAKKEGEDGFSAVAPVLTCVRGIIIGYSCVVWMLSHFSPSPHACIYAFDRQIFCFCNANTVLYITCCFLFCLDPPCSVDGPERHRGETALEEGSQRENHVLQRDCMNMMDVRS